MMAIHVSTGIVYAEEKHEYQVSVLVKDVFLGLSPDFARVIATQMIMNADAVDVANRKEESEVNDVGS